MSNMIADRYMVVTSLGEGGMADVYLAMDTILNREVAVKVLRGELSEDPVTLLRFLREASAVSKLHHPNVVEVYDVGEYEGKNFIVMEYIRGRTLKQMILQRGALPKEEAVEIMKQLVSAVNHAHENNIIHRDIKPQNVLVKDDGTVKITDFGIALAHDAIQLTQSDAVLGSAHYIAPETTKGEVATVQTDIYALGIVFYELLSGTVPFKGDNPIQVAMKHLREDIPSLRLLNPTIPQSIENIIIKATAKNRSKRYANAKDMLFDLDMCLLPEFAHVDKVSLDEEEIGSSTLILTNMSDLEANDGTLEMADDELRKIKQKANKNKNNKGNKNANDKKKKMLIIGGGVVVALLLLFGILYATGVFDSKPKEEEVVKVIVPDLEGKTEEEAKRELESNGLKLGNVDEQATDDIEKGIVFKQSVEKDKKVKKGSKVSITISSGKYFVVENYVGWTLADAQSKLEAAGIEVAVEYQETSDYVANNIISQSMLSAGTKVKPGESAKIKFVVAKEKKEEPKWETLDNYVGKTKEYVEKALAGKNIKITFTTEALLADDPDYDTKLGTVKSQTPAGGSTYNPQEAYAVTFVIYGPAASATPGQ